LQTFKCGEAIMAYTCEIGSGQHIYLDNQGGQTIVTSMSGGLGQQQQSSSSFQTGQWTAPPDLFQMPQGVVIRIHTSQGEVHIQVQGTSMVVMSASPGLGVGQQMQTQQVASMPSPSMQPMQPIPPMEPMQPMQPMQPMEPMSMGGMHLNMNPMEMRMGNMEMRMGSTKATKTPARFCSQCGAQTKPGDRFCSSCGHQLG
jgi:zinc-ribbon domain